MIAAGYGLGAALTSAPLAVHDPHARLPACLFFLGRDPWALRFCSSALLLVKPVAVRRPASRRAKRIYQGAELTPSQTIRTGVFWMIYLVYLLIAFGGMIMTAQLGPIARDFGLENRMVAFLGISAPVLAVAISIDNFANGITRPISGFLSDHIGRENMMLRHVHPGSRGAAAA